MPKAKLLATDAYLQKLPVQLRFMIWEYMWPDARLIQPVWHESESNPDEYYAFTILRPASPLSLKDLGSRTMKNAPFEHCPNPITLWICQDSREHTLNHYKLMEHSQTTAGSFYFSPSRDVLFLSMDYTDDPYYSDQLEQFYEGQLNHIKTVLVLNWKWVDTIRKALFIFGGLEIIRPGYLQGDEYKDDEEDDEDREDDEDEDDEEVDEDEEDE